MLHELQVGLCIVTETHLREADIEFLKFPTYHVVAHHCRPTPKGSHISGGVLILAHINFTTEVMPKNLDVLPVIGNCAVKLFPTDDPRAAAQITGVYISPSNTHRLQMEKLQQLSFTPKDTKLDDAPPLSLGR